MKTIEILFAIAMLLTSATLCLCAQKPEKPVEVVEIETIETEIETPTPSTQTSFPTQIVVFNDDGVWIVQVVVTLPNPCHKLEFIGIEKKNNTFVISFKHTPPKPEEVCIQVLHKYNQTVELGELREGSYKVVVEINGKTVREIGFNVKD